MATVANPCGHLFPGAEGHASDTPDALAPQACLRVRATDPRVDRARTKSAEAPSALADLPQNRRHGTRDHLRGDDEQRAWQVRVQRPVHPVSGIHAALTKKLSRDTDSAGLLDGAWTVENVEVRVHHLSLECS